MEDDDEEPVQTDEILKEPPSDDNQCAQISLKAIEGVSAFHTMRLTGHHGKKSLQLLLDTGSTHNFIDTTKAMKMDCKIEGINPMGVRVADGGKLLCDKIIRGFIWKMQGVEFKEDVLLLPLSGSDLVLGVHWFSQLGPVLWDFSKLTMQFTYKGVKVTLRGMQ